MVNSLAWTFSLLVDAGVVAEAAEVVVVAADVAAVVATPSVRTPGGQRWASREEGDRTDAVYKVIHERQSCDKATQTPR